MCFTVITKNILNSDLLIVIIVIEIFMRTDLYKREEKRYATNGRRPDGQRIFNGGGEG